MGQHLPTSLTTEEFSKLISYTTQNNHKVAFLLGFSSGMRVSEIVKLEQRDFNQANQSIFIRSGKGDKDRIVPIPKGWKDKYMSFIPIGISIRALEIAFKKAAYNAKLLEKHPNLHFHNLRHSFATRLVQQGTPIHYVRQLLGHSNISTTNVYLEANPKDALSKYQELF